MRDFTFYDQKLTKALQQRRLATKAKRLCETKQFKRLLKMPKNIIPYKMSLPLVHAITKKIMKNIERHKPKPKNIIYMVHIWLDRMSVRVPIGEPVEYSSRERNWTSDRTQCRRGVAMDIGDSILSYVLYCNLKKHYRLLKSYKKLYIKLQ